MEYQKFITACHSKHLTLANVAALHVGDTFAVVLWDPVLERRWISKPWSHHAKRGKLYDPATFFAQQKCQITYQGNWQVLVQEPDGFERISALWINTQPVAGPVNKWARIDQRGSYELWHRHRRSGLRYLIDSKALPKRVGIRGCPMMLWENLEHCGQVFYDGPRRSVR